MDTTIIRRNSGIIWAQTALRVVLALIVVAGLLGAAAPGVFAQGKSNDTDLTNWRGFHLGLNVGALWGHYDFGPSTANVAQVSGIDIFIDSARLAVPNFIVFVPPTTAPLALSETRNGGSFLYGSQVGFDVQLHHWVFGFEGDFDGTNLNRTSPNVVDILPATLLTTGATVAVHDTGRIDWVSTARLRVGLAHRHCMVYATGGAAFTDLEVTTTGTYTPVLNADAFNSIEEQLGPFTNSYTQSKLHIGWTVGAGFEKSFGHQMSWGVEYRYTNFSVPSHDFGSPTLSGSFATQSFGVTPGLTPVSLTTHQVSLKWNFRWPGFIGSR